MTSIGIVEDHPLYAEALRSALTEAGFDIAFVEGTLEDATRSLRVRVPDIMLIDLSLPDGDGLELPRRRHGKPRDRPSWVVLSSYDDARRAEEARSVGCLGFLSKRLTMEGIIEAILQVVAGQEAYHPRVQDVEARRFGITERELACLALVAEGFSNREIASSLGVTAETIKTMLTNARDKLGAVDRAHAVARAFEVGLLGRR